MNEQAEFQIGRWKISIPSDWGCGCLIGGVLFMWALVDIARAIWGPR